MGFAFNNHEKCACVFILGRLHDPVSKRRTWVEKEPPILKLPRSVIEKPLLATKPLNVRPSFCLVTGWILLPCTRNPPVLYDVLLLVALRPEVQNPTVVRRSATDFLILVSKEYLFLQNPPIWAPVV